MLEAVPLPVRQLSARSTSPSGSAWDRLPKMTSKMAKIAAFREWLLAEAADDAHHLAALGYVEVTAPAV
jgi:hypothetical protein